MRKLVIYVDMDGVVAKWNKYATLEDTHTPGYFYEREPELGLMDCIKKLAKDFAEASSCCCAEPPCYGVPR